MKFTAPRHLLVGSSFDTWCGIYGTHHRGTPATRDERHMTCGNCRRRYAAHLKREAAKGTAPKNVTPR